MSSLTDNFQNLCPIKTVKNSNEKKKNTPGSNNINTTTITKKQKSPVAVPSQALPTTYTQITLEKDEWKGCKAIKKAK